MAGLYKVDHAHGVVDVGQGQDINAQPRPPLPPAFPRPWSRIADYNMNDNSNTLAMLLMFALRTLLTH